jgi:Family of unknown function (DUF5681)
MPPDNEADYEVGYGKPPRHTRFKKGQSGNPRGRPNGSKNLSTLLSETLSEPVIVVLSALASAGGYQSSWGTLLLVLGGMKRYAVPGMSINGRQASV